MIRYDKTILLCTQIENLTGSQLSLPHITKILKITNTTTKKRKTMSTENKEKVREFVKGSPIVE